MLRLRCPYCGHEWLPRVPRPAMCPKCNQRFAWSAKNPEEVKEGE